MLGREFLLSCFLSGNLHVPFRFEKGVLEIFLGKVTHVFEDEKMVI